MSVPGNKRARPDDDEGDPLLPPAQQQSNEVQPGPGAEQADVVVKKARFTAASLPPRPRPPYTGYITFLNDNRPRIKEERPEAPSTDIIREIARLWRTLDPPVKQRYLEEAAERRAKYDVELKAWEANKAALQDAGELPVLEPPGPRTTSRRVRPPTLPGDDIASPTPADAKPKRKLGRPPKAKIQAASPQLLASIERLWCDVCQRLYASKCALSEHRRTRKHLARQQLRDEGLLDGAGSSGGGAGDSSSHGGVGDGGGGADSSQHKGSTEPASGGAGRAIPPAATAPLSRAARASSPKAVTVFSDEFISHNREREKELRSLKQSNQQLLQANSTLKEQIGSLRQLTSQLEDSETRLQQWVQTGREYLESAQSLIARSLTGIKDPVTGLEPSADTLQAYLKNVSAALSVDSGDDATLQKVQAVLIQISANPFLKDGPHFDA